MVSALIAALVAMTFLCLLLGWSCFRLVADRDKAREDEASRHQEWMAEKKEMDRYLTGVLRVLNSSVGGISKRISESSEIADAIQSQAPDLFKRCDGLAYWLHANDQFLAGLYAAAAEGIDPGHRQRVHDMKTCRTEVFDRIYECAGLPVPSI